MADEKNENALGVQTDQSQSDNQAAPTPQGPSPAEDLADLVPVNESEKPLAGAHPESATDDLAPVSGTEKKLSLPENQTIQASGVIGPTSIGPRDSNFHNWLQDVQSDVKNGSSSTWVGAMLKKFGAKGTTYGVNPEIGDLMAGPVLGVPKALEGTSEIAEQLDEGVRNSSMDYGKTVRGINKVVGGVLGSVAVPAMIAAPGGEALAVAVPAMIAQSQAEKAAKYMGADDDTAELVGNVAGVYAGGKIHASLHPVVERFGVAVNSRTAAEQEYNSRSRELETARGQAAEMQQRAHDAAGHEASKAQNPATASWELDDAKKATDDARTAASEATKNVANAQKAFDQAAARRADATIQLEKLGRQITKSADKATAAEYESRASEQKKASDLFRKAVPSKGANQYTPEDEDIARAHMEEAKNGGAKIVDLPTAYEAVEGGRQGIEDKLQPHLGKYADESLTDKPEDSPKIQVAQKLDEMAKVDGNFANAMDSLSEFNITDPSVKEGQEMLTKLNNYNRAAMKSANNWDIYNMIETKPDFAARFFMADALRDALYNKLEQHGIEGAREARSETASLIRVRDAIGAQIRANRGGTTVRGSGTQSKMRLLTAKLTGKAIKGAGIAGGAEVGGPVGAVAGGALGEMAAQPVEDFLAPRDLTRDQHIEKSMKYKGTNRKPVQIKGTGSPAVPVPTEPIPPPVKLAPESLELTPRENTELHAELAAHYGESNLEDSTYAELEKQLRDDVAAKNRSGVALDPAEKTLLTKILKADSADRAITQAAGKPGVEVKIDPKKEDEIIKEADQRAEEGEPTKLNPHLVSLGRGDESALVAHSPAMKAHAPAMVVPGLPNGMTTDDAHLHEWAHTAIGAVDGLEPVEIRSDIHPKSEKGAGATAVFNGASIRDADGNIDPEGLSKQETQWLTQKMAGPASHEVFKGMTREEVKAHPATRSDFRQSRAIVREVHPDFTPSQVEAVVDAAYDRARDFLTKPHIADRIRANAAVREEGLSHTLHASHGRVNQFAEDIRNAHSEYTGGESGPDGGGAGEVSEKAEKPAAEGEEKNAGRDKSGSGKGTPKPAVEVAATSREPKVKDVAESKIDDDTALALNENKLGGKGQYPDWAEAAVRAIRGTENRVKGKIDLGSGPLPDKADIQKVGKFVYNYFQKKLSDDFIGNVNPGDWARVMLHLFPGEEIFSKMPDMLGKIDPKYGNGKAIDVDAIRSSTINQSQPELRVPFKEGREAAPERTTGEHDEAIKKGGGIPAGIQKGDPEIGLKELALFHDPTTASTLALPTDKVTAESVKNHLQKSRATYLEAKPEESRIPTQGQPGYDAEIHGAPTDAAAGAGPDLQTTSDKLIDKYGTTENPHDAGFILSDGRMVPLHGEHDSMLKSVGGPQRGDFINDENAVRTRLRSNRAGKEVVFSVPKSGVSTEQLEQIKKSVGQLRNGNVVMEVGESKGKSTSKELARVSDVEPMLREIGAHPEKSDWMEKAAATNGEGFSFHPKTGEAPKDGYMVETELNRGQQYDHPPTAEDIRAYTEKNKDILDKNPDLYVGGYKNSLGLSKNFADRAAAEELGQKTNQISIYDVAGGKEIPTGGTGEVTPEMVEQSQIKKSPKGSSVPLMNNPLDVKGSGDNGEVNTLDITKALNKFSRKSNPALEPGSGSGQMVERARKIAEDEAKYQLAQSKTGTEWYTTEMKDHDKVLQDLRPELTKGEMTDSLPDHPVNLTLFKAAEAILSSGQKPYANVKSAMRAWDHYKETGEFAPVNPATGKSWGPRNVAAYGNAFESMNRLIKEKGEKGAADWLLAEHPVSELKQYNPEGVSGKKTDQAAGAMILGQKRGPFMQNLHGIESKFTADMWVSRTWNRWMGTLDLDPRIEDKGKVTSESDAPRNNGERSLMKESFEKTAQKLNLTTSSLQAVLWYYEQALYRAHGIPVESWSFSDAAKRVAAEQKAVPEAEQTGFDFGANKDKKAEGGFANMAGTVKPKAAGAVHAFDFLNALQNSHTDKATYSVPKGWNKTGPVKAPGMIQPGNIDLTTRPVVKNDDGTTSSEYSTSFEDDKGHEVLVPTVVNGKFLTPDGKKPKPGSPEEKAMFQKAWQHYKQSGQHLGIFDSPEHADAAAELIHNRSKK